MGVCSRHHATLWRDGAPLRKSVEPPGRHEAASARSKVGDRFVGTLWTGGSDGDGSNSACAGQQTMQRVNTVVAVYGTHPQAEDALRAFQSSGFDMKKLSIVGKDYHTEEHVIGFYNAGDRMKFWGKRGAFWGGFWSMLFGSALFLIPGFGHVMVLGPLVGWVVGALGEAAVVGGLTALGAGLYSIGIPKDSILKYETALKADQFVIVAHGTPDEVTTAKRILEKTSPISLDEHGAPAAG